MGLFALGPNTAFTLTLFGVLFIYCEFVWPGKFIPGIAGALMTLIGIYFLWQHRPGAVGLAMLVFAVLCFAAEFLVNTWFLAGLMGTPALAWGFWKLYSTPPWIVAGLAFPLSIVFGAVTIFLAYVARRARQNKLADLVGN